MNPSFLDIFNPIYDNYSIRQDLIEVPAHFKKFDPTVDDNDGCVLVISPDPSLGASKWTLNNKWITIAIYKDEGRPKTQKPIKNGLSWSRVGLQTTVIDNQKHNLRTGERVHVWNVNVEKFTNIEITVLDEYSFTFRGAIIGSTSGNLAAYQPAYETNFYEEYRVARLLPSFKLVPWSFVFELFESTKPINKNNLRSIYNISSNQDERTPRVISEDIHYESFTNLVSSNNRRFRQKFNESGNPLKITYSDTGFPEQINNVDSKFKNEVITFNQPGFNDLSRIRVYDYYGFELNDPSRLPYLSDTNVTKDSNGNLVIRKDNSNHPIYQSSLHDEFGNLAIKASEDNTLVTKKQTLPIKLDRFNYPESQ